MRQRARLAVNALDAKSVEVHCLDTLIDDHGHGQAVALIQARQAEPEYGLRGAWGRSGGTAGERRGLSVVSLVGTVSRWRWSLGGMLLQGVARLAMLRMLLAGVLALRRGRLSLLRGRRLSLRGLERQGSELRRALGSDGAAATIVPRLRDARVAVGLELLLLAGLLVQHVAGAEATAMLLRRGYRLLLRRGTLLLSCRHVRRRKARRGLGRRLLEVVRPWRLRRRHLLLGLSRRRACDLTTRLRLWGVRNGGIRLMAHAGIARCCQYGILLVLDLAMGRQLRVMGQENVVEVLLVVDGHDSLAETAGPSSETLSLDRADTKAVAQEKLLAEGCYKGVSCEVHRRGRRNLPNFCIWSAKPASVSLTKSCSAAMASGLVLAINSAFSLCNVCTLA